METAVYENICTSLFAHHSCYETDSESFKTSWSEAQTPEFGRIYFPHLEGYSCINCESCILFIIDYASWSKMETRNRKLAEDIESQLHKTHHEKRNVRFER